MDDTRFDTITRLFARRRLSRPQAISETRTGRAAGAIGASSTRASAQDATPAPDAPTAPEPPELLFVQSFQSGTITPSEGEDSRYTVTLDHGIGQTIHFSDRPDRIVGATPTEQFLSGLGFTPDNPPNAAIITANEDGETTLAVVELFDPVYDTESATITYEMAMLEHWEDSASMGFTKTPVDLDALGASFGTTHLFIDGLLDCPDAEMECRDMFSGDTIGVIPNSDHDGYCRSGRMWDGHYACLPCSPWYSSGDDALSYWNAQCNERFEDCNGRCEVWPIDSVEA